MANIFFFVALASMMGVVLSFLLGMAAMTKLGDEARRNSNKMMRFRVILQTIAILFLTLAYLAK